jgi:ABC-type branched-subunit amino acid transport system ATPase component
LALLEVEEVYAGYGGSLVLNGVSIRVEEGELVTIIGPNGSGKSTLLKTVFGIVKPTRGRVFFNGEEVTGLGPHLLVARGLGYVPQLDNVFPNLTVEENLEMGAYSQRRRAADLVEEVATIFPVLKEKRRERARNLSGGERQMLAMARALVARPKLLLLDEPTASLAPALVDGVLSRLQAIVEAGTAILLVEQNAAKSLQIANRGYVLVMGRTAYEGPARSLLESPEIGRLYLGRKK